jgi:16S rRNA (guanine527-N7)-methyltransferase
LVKWQRVQRLLSSTDPAWIVEHALLDSLLFAPLLPSEARAVMDVGSGAGIPGVPLKIAFPETEVALLESRAKRASFLSAVVRALSLPSCEVLHARLESLDARYVGRYDALVMRCAGDPASLLDASVRLLRSGGLLIASGPPKPRKTDGGEWQEVDGPGGRRWFWVYRT